jgi:hypothetical protein
VVFATSVGLGVAMLSLLLAALSIAVNRPDGVALYGLLCAAAAFGVFWLLRYERRRKQAGTTERTAGRRRGPIRLPLRAGALTFFAWYAAALALEYAVNGRLFWFDVVAIAPFAAFMLTVFTFAGRHIAFRLTGEERGDGV